jgi:hypothetical protein
MTSGTSVLYAGADVREAPGNPARDWDAPRRESFLLRLDVARPLSVDRSVWNSPEHDPVVALGAPLPWIPIAAVRDRALAAKIPGVVLLIGLVTSSAAERHEAAQSMGIDTELSVEPTWQFLGFDIADGSSISGLSNCGYAENEAATLRPRWAHRLNDHGLFSNVDDALAFRQVANDRVPEHAPFFVFGLWVLPRGTLRAGNRRARQRRRRSRIGLPRSRRTASPIPDRLPRLPGMVLRRETHARARCSEQASRLTRVSGRLSGCPTPPSRRTASRWRRHAPSSGPGMRARGARPRRSSRCEQSRRPGRRRGSDRRA